MARPGELTEITATVARIAAVEIDNGGRRVELPVSQLTFLKRGMEVDRPEVGETYDIHLPATLAEKVGLL
jgi:hypothetical protein